MAEITRDEFLAHMAHLSGGVAEIKDHLEKLNGRTRKAEESIAVLNDRATRGAVIATGAASAIAAVIEGVHIWLSR